MDIARGIGETFHVETETYFFFPQRLRKNTKNSGKYFEKFGKIAKNLKIRKNKRDQRTNEQTNQPTDGQGVSRRRIKSVKINKNHIADSLVLNKRGGVLAKKVTDSYKEKRGVTILSQN